MLLAFSPIEFFSDHLIWLIPTMTLGVLSVYVLALVMWLHFFHLRFHGWWIVTGVFALLMTQSFTVLMAIEAYRQYMMSEYLWDHNAVEFAIVVATWCLVLGCVLGMIWVFLPGIKSEEKEKARTPKVISFLFYLIWLWLMGGYTTDRIAIFHDWPDRFPEIVSEVDLGDGDRLLIGVYLDRNEDGRRQMYSALMIPGYDGLMHRKFLRAEGVLHDYYGHPYNEYDVSLPSGVFVSDDGAIMYLSTGYTITVITRDGMVLHRASQLMIDVRYFEDIDLVTAWTEDAEAIPLVIQSYEVNSGKGLLGNWRDRDQAILYLLCLYQRHGLAHPEINLTEEFWGWKAPRIELKEIDQANNTVKEAESVSSP